MSESKPVTDYYNDKYKHETLQTANVQSLLGEVTDPCEENKDQGVMWE